LQLVTGLSMSQVGISTMFLILEFYRNLPPPPSINLQKLYSHPTTVLD
jgi:hypothetical protein